MTNSDFARNIAIGEKRRRDTNYDEIEARILAKLKKLPSYDLDWVECMINHLIARTQHPPEPPRMDERPEFIPATREPFKGTEQNPVPLKTDIDTINFAGLIKMADKLDVPHYEELWLDDDWPDKEDELRVAVAEAMEKVGK